jgi:hypothetical protein
VIRITVIADNSFFIFGVMPEDLDAGILSVKFVVNLLNLIKSILLCQCPEIKPGLLTKYDL